MLSCYIIYMYRVRKEGLDYKVYNTKRKSSKYHEQFPEVFEKEARGQNATMGIATEMTNIIHME